MLTGNFPEINYIHEVATLGLGEDVAAMERANRLAFVRDCLAERALEIATSPSTPQGDAFKAERLYDQINLAHVASVEQSKDASNGLSFEQSKTREAILGTFDTSYATYSTVVRQMNEQRVSKFGLSADTLPIVGEDIIKKRIEALLSNPVLLSEIQADINYFIENPEQNSPEAGYDIVIVPEGYTSPDRNNTARLVQFMFSARLYGTGKLRYIPDYPKEIGANVGMSMLPSTGRGYRLALAPRHYNLQAGTGAAQLSEIQSRNLVNTSLIFRIPDHVEALTQYGNLIASGQLDDQDTRKDSTYFGRIDDKMLPKRRSSILFIPDDDHVIVNSISEGGNSADFQSNRALIIFG
jgi:hypothetical protein